MSPSVRSGPTGHPPVLVVAGATGTGKSTVCGWLAQRGAAVIDADGVGHEMLARSAIRARLVEVFGEDVLGADGEIDRRALGARVFADEAALARLNTLVHPPLVAEIERRIDHLRREGDAPLIVVDAALHFQFEPRIACDLVVMTTVARAEQLRRVMDRDGMSAELARERIERQREVEASLPLADAVLDTSAPPDAVRKRLLEIVDARLGVDLRHEPPPGGGEAAPPDADRPTPGPTRSHGSS